jgi:hypothetical protein
MNQQNGSKSSTWQLAQGEVTKRDVTVTSAKGPLGWIESRIVITDARLVYLAEAKNKLGSSRTASEIQLNDVGSISHYVNRGLSGFALVVAPILVLLGLVFLLFDPTTGVISLAIAAVVIIAGRNAKSITFEITSRSQGGVAISLAHQSGGPIRNAIIGILSIGIAPIVRLLFPRLGIMDALSAASVNSTDEAADLFLEIGAVVLDLQSRGSFGA